MALRGGIHQKAAAIHGVLAHTHAMQQSHAHLKRAVAVVPLCSAQCIFKDMKYLSVYIYGEMRHER